MPLVLLEQGLALRVGLWIVLLEQQLADLVEPVQALVESALLSSVAEYS
jgi:hypothetical protein